VPKATAAFSLASLHHQSAISKLRALSMRELFTIYSTRSFTTRQAKNVPITCTGHGRGCNRLAKCSWQLQFCAGWHVHIPTCTTLAAKACGEHPLLTTTNE
jgi:hypothetical protein